MLWRRCVDGDGPVFHVTWTERRLQGLYASLDVVLSIVNGIGRLQGAIPPEMAPYRPSQVETEGVPSGPGSPRSALTG